jgi:hypothetical protein
MPVAIIMLGKDPNMRDTIASPQLVLCVPGPWEDRSAFLRDLIESTQGQFIGAGAFLMQVGAQDAFQFEFASFDAHMADAFRAAGPHWRDAPDMARIATHRSVIYLLGKGDSDEGVEALMLAARALLDAGGFGVKVESTGLAHAPDAWRTMCTDIAAFSPYRAFVVVVTGAGEACSCGMHTFGMRDVVVEDDDPESALYAARTFSWYLFTERPHVEAGQTFACDAEAPVYRIEADDRDRYEHGSLFNNPYGMWRLRLA